MPCFGAMKCAIPGILPLSSADHPQVEYLVVNYSDDDPKVLLSLRQAEILEALAADQDLAKQGGCVPALQDGPANNNTK